MALAITAVPVSVGVLMSMGRLDTPVPAGVYLFPWIGRRVAAAHGEEFEFSFLVLAGLGYAVLAEALSMHFLIGAFLAGLFFVRRTIDEETYDDVFRKVSALTHGFLAPVFFASIGIHLHTGALLDTPLFLVALVLVATAGKLLGAGIPAWLGGLGRRDSLAVGVGMNARGAVELIVADVALRAGLFDQPEPPPPIVASLYAGVVATAILTTLATPIGLKWLYRE